MPRYALSVASVARVQRLDGRSRITAVLRDQTIGWERTRQRCFLTPETLAALERDGVRTVELRRRFRRGRVPLVWFPRAAAGVPV